MRFVVIVTLFPFARVLLLILVLSGHALAQTNPFESEIRVFEAEDARSPAPANSIVFIGSSTINNWDGVAAAFPRFNVLNRGFGGSETSDALYFVDRIATPYRPALVVFYEGDNDLAAGKSVDQIFSDTTNFFARVQTKSPNTHILYISVKPSPSRVSILASMRTLNEKIREFTTHNPKLHYVNVFTPMLNANGQPRPELFLSDDLHMNETGYALWTSILSPVLDAFAATYPIPITRQESGSLLIDLGGKDAPSGSTARASVSWNNVSTATGASSSGVLDNLLTVSGVSTTARLQMVSRFNGANENGTTASTLFPESASRDSLFGNTETFSGLANVTPIFKLSGLPAGNYRFTFYASRTGVSDNRQTRYTVTGSTTGIADLNPVNNIDETAAVAAIQPDEGGSITVALTPGPSNNNANHFTYLGAMRLENFSPGGSDFLFDFGAAGSLTQTQTVASAIRWNNLFAEVGATDTGLLTNLVALNGGGTGIDLQMISRFNGVNSNGATNAAVFPATATRDSLFGNTETFGGLMNISPAFRLRNLSASARYTLTFYASRLGAVDNRQTRYAVTGMASAETDLDASANFENVATLSNLEAGPARDLTISLSPGPENNNANHFTYLGVLRLDWIDSATAPPIKLSQPVRGMNGVQLRVSGAPGMIYTVQTSMDLRTWRDAASIQLSSESGEIEIADASGDAFYRLLQ